MKKILFNIMVVLFDRLSMLAFQIWMSSYFVHVLGIDGFGNWSLIFNVMNILGAVCILSIDVVVVRDIVNHKDRYYQYLNAALLIQLMGSITLFCMGLLLYGHKDGLIFCSFLSIIIGNFCIILNKYPTWHYSALVESKYRSLSITISLAITIILLYLFLPIVKTQDYVVFIYAMYYAIQLIVINIIYVWLFKGRYHFCLDVTTVKQYIKVGCKLIVSTVSVMLFTQSDIVMIEYFLSATDVGEFAAATKLTTSIFMIAGILANTFYPMIIGLSDKIVMLFMRSLLTLILLATIVGAIIISMCADWLVSIIYYPSSNISMILALHVWCAIFIFTGAFTAKYLYRESLYKIEVLKTVYAAIFHIVMNMWMIPVFGVMGAVYSSFLTYFIADFIMFAFFQETRVLFKIQLEAYMNVLNIKKLATEIKHFRRYF